MTGHLRIFLFPKLGSAIGNQRPITVSSQIVQKFRDEGPAIRSYDTDNQRGLDYQSTFSWNGKPTSFPPWKKTMAGFGPGDDDLPFNQISSWIGRPSTKEKSWTSRSL